MGIQDDKIREELSNLICRDLIGELDEAEKLHLRSLERRCGLESTDRIRIAQRLHEEREFDSMSAYADFRRLTSKKGKSLYRSVLRIGLAAAATVVLFMGVWLTLVQEKRELQPVAMILPEQVIAPGTSKATITLAGGQQVKLGGSKQRLQEQNGTILDLDSTVVEYKGNVTSDRLVYNTISIPLGGEYQLLLTDGTKVWINADSKLKFPVNFGGKSREVFLEGEAYFEVKKDENRPFLVHTSRGVIKVLGTGFNVRDYRNEQKVVATLVEGRIAYRPGNKSMREVVLNPGFQIQDIEGGSLNPKQVDILLYTGWKDGKYIFENTSLEEIMQTLERWYNVTIFWQNPMVKQLHFTGDLERYESINTLLQFMETGGDVKFEIKGKTIIVKRK